MSLRIGVLGCADICDSVVPTFTPANHATVTSVSSRDASKAEARREKYQAEKAHGSYQELLDARQVDAIYIPLPNALHCEWSKAALNASYHVLCEKPLALSARDASSVVECARGHKVVLYEGFMYRHHGVYQSVRDSIAAGVIGKVRSIDAAFTFCLTPDEAEGSIVYNKALGGGSLNDVGCYCVHAARSILQCEPVSAYGETCNGSAEVDETFTGILRFPNDVVLQFVSSIVSTERHTLSVHGESGTLVVEWPWVQKGFGAATLRIERLGCEPEQVSIDECLTGEETTWDLQTRDFVAATRDERGMDRPCHPNSAFTLADDIIANARALEALQRSAESGRCVQLSEVEV